MSIVIWKKWSFIACDWFTSMWWRTWNLDQNKIFKKSNFFIGSCWYVIVNNMLEVFDYQKEIHNCKDANDFYAEFVKFCWDSIKKTVLESSLLIVTMSWNYRTFWWEWDEVFFDKCEDLTCTGSCGEYWQAIIENFPDLSPEELIKKIESKFNNIWWMIRVLYFNQ